MLFVTRDTTISLQALMIMAGVFRAFLSPPSTVEEVATKKGAFNARMIQMT
jgi:hypothetical protein